MKLINECFKFCIGDKLISCDSSPSKVAKRKSLILWYVQMFLCHSIIKKANHPYCLFSHPFRSLTQYLSPHFHSLRPLHVHKRIVMAPPNFFLQLNCSGQLMHTWKALALGQLPYSLAEILIEMRANLSINLLQRSW